MKNQPIRIVQYGMSDTLGGVETFVMNLYRNIDRSRIQFDFLLPHTVVDMPFGGEVKKMGGRIYPVLYSQRESMKLAHDSLYDFFEEHRDIKGIHVNATLMTHDRLMKTAARYQLPIRIFHSHNAKFDEHMGIITKLLSSHARSTVMNKSTALFACSSLAAEYMFHKTSGVTIVPNAIDTIRFAYNPIVREQLRSSLGIDGNTRVIGFVGRLHGQKNPLFLLDIFAAVHAKRPDTMLMICGDGELRSEMEQKCTQLSISDDVRFMGVRQDIEKYYQVFDEFLFPSAYEGLGIVLVEAQCAGLHCVTTRGRVPSEADVTGNVDFLPFEAEAEQWAEYVASHLDDDRFDRSRQVMQKGYDIKSMASMVQEYYLTHVDN